MLLQYICRVVTIRPISILCFGKLRNQIPKADIIGYPFHILINFGISATWSIN